MALLDKQIRVNAQPDPQNSGTVSLCFTQTGRLKAPVLMNLLENAIGVFEWLNRAGFIQFALNLLSIFACVFSKAARSASTKNRKSEPFFFAGAKHPAETSLPASAIQNAATLNLSACLKHGLIEQTGTRRIDSIACFSNPRWRQVHPFAIEFLLLHPIILNYYANDYSSRITVVF
jgi:hypothetical protein